MIIDEPPVVKAEQPDTHAMPSSKHELYVSGYHGTALKESGWTAGSGDSAPCGAYAAALFSHKPLAAA